MNSPFFKNDNIVLLLDSLQPYSEIKDKELFLAILCAFLAHGGKKDKEGEPYIKHPIRVASNVEGKDAKVVALLHDVLEDSSITSDNLREMGFSSIVIEAVKSLTRGVFQDYSSYLDQVAKNPLAVKVKIADIEDNMNLERLNKLDSFTKNRLIAKYKYAIEYLNANNISLG